MEHCAEASFEILVGLLLASWSLIDIRFPNPVWRASSKSSSSVSSSSSDDITRTSPSSSSMSFSSSKFTTSEMGVSGMTVGTS
ncbi:hypothetical protein WICPIJ_006005 [Wickerhamomyces pijperi]|uniref:Uncharacterized protein n=1 Tax=Wickerhamomyces pijperi TaxID=599730 RepID=A0A9P8Q2W5_WICPI|nr:hypothetical protein WICPIJ_006005 [Wickerhamomyces pijperi]